jgi:aminocarboxymuconate-semialdehyde decarboxylase
VSPGPDTSPVIDLHNHVSTPACEAMLDGPAPLWLDPFTRYSGAETRAYNAQHFAGLLNQLTDPDRRLADMDRMRIEVQALSPAPPQFYYWTDPGLGRRLARRQNEHVAELVAGHPDRFVGLGTVPLQDGEAAVAELDHCITQLGLRGVEICSSVNGLDLDQPRFRPFFARAAELDVVVLIHPHGFTGGERLTEYYLTNVIGNPLDTPIAVTRLIHGGVLEEVPGLKLCLTHGGGYLPFYASRMDHAWRNRPEGRPAIPDRPPSSYLRQVYADGLVYDQAHLAFLVQQLGPGHVVLGTDYPYDMGDVDAVALVEKMAELMADDRAAILGGTAARLLNL